MKTDIDSLNFDAIPRAFENLRSSLTSIVDMDIPDDVDEASTEVVERINERLSFLRSVKKLPLPPSMESIGDVKASLHRLDDEATRLNKLSADGASVQNNSSGIGITVD